MPTKWTDVEDIALYLAETFPERDPLTVRFTELRDLVLDMPDFDDEVSQLHEKILEAIQMAWYEEYQEGD